MTAALRLQASKEARALLPWWAATAATMIFVGVLEAIDPRVNPVLQAAASLAFAVGTTTLGALSIGHEFNYRTLSTLLVQPISRPRLVWIKLAVLVVAIAALSGIALVTPVLASDPYRRSIFFNLNEFRVAPILCGLFIAPVLTLLTRTAIAGAVFSVALPFLSFLLLASVGSRLAFLDWTALLAAVGGVAMWPLFLRLQVIDGGGRSLSIPSWRRPLDGVFAEDPHGWFWLLLKKEVRLQQMTLTVAGLYVAAWMAMVIARRIDPANLYVGPSMWGLTSMYAPVVAVLAGAFSAASERQLGTDQWQLLLPAPASKIWGVKIAVAFGLTAALGLGLPVLLSLIYNAPSTPALNGELILAVFGCTVVGLYLSSVSTTGLRALLASFPVIAGGMVVLALFLAPIGVIVHRVVRPLALAYLQPLALDNRAAATGNGITGLMLLAGLAMLLLFLGFHNFQTLDRSRGRLTRQGAVIAIYAVSAMCVFAVVMTVLSPGVRVRLP